MPLWNRPPDEPPEAAPAGPIVANPLRDAFDATTGGDPEVGDTRVRLIATYGFAIPTERALDAIQHCSPAGVVEIAAGTGYWAHCLHRRGVDVVAFDVEPAPSPLNKWFAGTPPWHRVQRGDHTVAGSFPNRTLLIIWPTTNEIWAAAAAECFYASGGERLVYVGEGPGGRTGDDVFHALLGEISVCVQCRYGTATSPCICGVDARWQRIATIELPHWPGYHDDLHIYARHVRRRRRRAKSGRGAYA